MRRVVWIRLSENQCGMETLGLLEASHGHDLLSENQCGMETELYGGYWNLPDDWLSENQCGMETKMLIGFFIISKAS